MKVPYKLEDGTVAYDRFYTQPELEFIKEVAYRYGQCGRPMYELEDNDPCTTGNCKECDNLICPKNRRY